MNQILEQKININVSRGLDASAYFQAVVQEAARLSLFLPDELERLQYQILELLTAQFNRYTSGFSSSVPVETGQRIQQSTFYTVGFYLKKLTGPEECIRELKDGTLTELFHKGKKQIEEELQASKDLLALVQGSLLDTDILAYNDTIREGIPLFFTSYDVDYGTHESPGSIDYPLSNDQMIMTGIEYITDYLKKIQLENQFCNRYPQEEVCSLFRGSGPMYKEQLFNIFDLILGNSIASLLLERSAFSLQVTDYDRQFLRYILNPLSRDQVDNLIDRAVFRLCSEPALESVDMRRYISQSIIKLKSRLRHALETDSLHLLFPSLRDADNHRIFLFRDKNNMDNDKFRALSEEIRSCRYGSDKLQILKGVSLSLTDLTDLLEGSCFFDEEYESAFGILEDIQLALLLKKLPLKPADLAFQQEDDESPKEWQIRFMTFLDRMEPERKNKIKSFSRQLQDHTFPR